MLFALAGEFDGLHRQDLVVTHRVLCVDEWVMMWEIDLAVVEVGGRGESFGDVGKHVRHCLVDARPVRVAVNPLSILGESWEVEGFGGTIPA